MSGTIDQANRERFVTELNTNFSVVAAAGSGKTRAITDRIVQIARSPAAREELPQLVVVAFTNRAADEMQQRARAEVLQAKVPLQVLAAFNGAFFGTIHAFCVRLLETYGHYLGLPPTFEVITDDDEIWNEFTQQRTTVGCSLSPENRRELLRHIQARTLMELGRHADLNVGDPPDAKCPDADFSEIYNYVAKGSARQTIPAYQKALKRAEQLWRAGEEFLRWPICGSQARDFVPRKRAAFAPLRRWLDQAALCVAAEVQRDYRDFRIGRGLLTYDDQVVLALELTDHPEIGPEIREKSFRVILDEAQDTDPRQFSLLLELTRPPEVKGDWLETKRAGPRPGHFCMVGDFQQSIYRDRADLSRYRRIHDMLCKTGAAEALEFSVTFRLDTAQLNLVNETFREILNDRDRQVAFVELNPRPEILPGQVVRLDLEAGDLQPDARGRISDTRKAAEEARQLGTWLSQTGLARLRAQTWRDVAILCPRKEWLQTLRHGLRAARLNVQIQSEKELKGDSPAYAWLTALLIIMTGPRRSYEIAGLLRELFGVSDHDLAVFSQGYGDRFQIETLTSGSDLVSRKLSLLARIRLSILRLPLFDAVTEIVERTQLRERLSLLPREDFENLHGELDGLLALAGSSEADEITLAEFADLLRLHFADPRDVRPSRPDSIQLITSQKAKGSQWQAVIVPFLTRKVRTASPRYPRLIKDQETGRTLVLLDNSDVTPEIEEATKREERQDMERLLYVALTRAQHTLVLVFDHQLFAKEGGALHQDSQTKWLKADKNEPNETPFANVATQPGKCTLTAGYYDAKSGAKLEQVERRLPDTTIDNAAAARNASVFFRKLNPSVLPIEEIEMFEKRWTRDESQLLPRPATQALRYGLWWHDLVQRLSWNQDPDSWNALFEERQKVSPDPPRSLKEWKHLLSEAPDFRRRFGFEDSITHTEMPFLWRVDEHRVLEGIIDLAVFAPARKKWFVLDWKTNRIKEHEVHSLQTHYLAQLAAYWKAIGEITGAEAEAAIYSTATGKLVFYNRGDLAREWEQLRTLSPDQLEAKVSPERLDKNSAQLELPGL
jgi:ATP-dependent exoDNAse (exonuclease V) beta subunit